MMGLDFGLETGLDLTCSPYDEFSRNNDRLRKGGLFLYYHVIYYCIVVLLH